MTTNWWDLPEDDDPKPWTLADIYNDLGNLHDVALALNIKYARIMMWQQRAERLKPPKPVRTVSGGNLYSIQEWRDWFHNFTKDRRPGTKWSTEAQPYTPARHRTYGNGGLASVLREAAKSDDRTAD